jgi:hypothetical protein
VSSETPGLSTGPGSRGLLCLQTSGRVGPVVGVAGSGSRALTTGVYKKTLDTRLRANQEAKEAIKDRKRDASPGEVTGRTGGLSTHLMKLFRTVSAISSETRLLMNLSRSG